MRQRPNGKKGRSKSTIQDEHNVPTATILFKLSKLEHII